MKRIAVLFLIIICLANTITANAASYTYNSEGKAVESPDAYTVESDFNGVDLGIGSFKKPIDIKISKSGIVAISDYENSRVVITDTSFKETTLLAEFDRDGKKDSIKSPMGMCFDEKENLYVCDKENRRIIQFDKNLNYIREISNPKQELLPEGFIFAPSAVAVDKWDTLYCISDSSTNGYLQFDENGEFKGFFGSPTVTLSLAEKFWRSIQTKAQRSRTVSQVPINFNNIVVDNEGFVYTTQINDNVEGAANAIQSGEKDGVFMPIKKFNFNGTCVLKRYDFFAPAGDIDFEKSIPENERNVGEIWSSDFVSITLGDDGCYFAADSKRGKIFGYDYNGNLLYSFGGTGAQKGFFSHLSAVTYYNDRIYALDQNLGTVTCFCLTDYGKKIHTASRLTTQRRFDEAADEWSELLKQNQNLTIAYIGLGRSYLESGEYQKAMNYFKTALDMNDYNEALTRYREELLGDWFLLIPLAVVLFIALIYFLFVRIKKFNEGTSPKKRTLLGELSYAGHIVFHPFDGFWDVKHEKRGSVKAALIFMIIAAVCVALQNRMMGFAFNMGKSTNIILIILVVLGAALVFAVSNWCLTSLTDGKGNFKDILTVIGYSCVPLIVMSLPIAVLSNVLTTNESGFITLFIYISYIWTALLLFIGIMTMHQYNLGRNIASVVCTLVGMIVIVFLVFLIINLGNRIVSFIAGIVNELGLRS